MTNAEVVILPLAENIANFERAVESIEPGSFSGKDLDLARNTLALAISSACSVVPPMTGSQLDALFARMEKSGDGKRQVAILLIRSLAVEGLLPVDIPESRASRVIPILVEEVAPDIAKYCKTADKKLNFEKISSLRGFHSFVCSGFSVLSTLPKDLAEINNLKSSILKSFSNKLYQAYLQPFNFTIIRAKVESICEQIERLVGCKDEYGQES